MHAMMTMPIHDDIYKLVRDPIDVAALVRHVRAPEDGAIVTFDGFVRNQSHDHPPLYLDYEPDEHMALAKIRESNAQPPPPYPLPPLPLPPPPPPPQPTETHPS